MYGVLSDPILRVGRGKDTGKGLAGRDVKDDTRIYYIGAYPAAGPELCPYIKFACGV